jgi:hypothetical protein
MDDSLLTGATRDPVTFATPRLGESDGIVDNGELFGSPVTVRVVQGGWRRGCLGATAVLRKTSQDRMLRESGLWSR